MTLFRNSAGFERLLALVCKSILVLLILSECCTAQKPPPTPSSIYERTHLSIVVVVTADKDAKPVGQGSGFIVGKNKIVTNHHVIDGAAAVIVVFADGATSEVEGVIADSPTRDLTILAVNTGTRAALRLGDELSVRQLSLQDRAGVRYLTKMDA